MEIDDNKIITEAEAMEYFNSLPVEKRHPSLEINGNKIRLVSSRATQKINLLTKYHIRMSLEIFLKRSITINSKSFRELSPFSGKDVRFLYFVTDGGSVYKIGTTNKYKGAKTPRLTELKCNFEINRIVCVYEGTVKEVVAAEAAIKRNEVLSEFANKKRGRPGWSEIYKRNISKFSEFIEIVSNLKLIDCDVAVKRNKNKKDALVTALSRLAKE